MKCYPFKNYLLILPITLITACTHGVLSIPPANVQYFENTSGRAIRLESTGLAIDTNRDSSVSFGHLVKTYFYQGEPNRPSEQLNIDNSNQLKTVTVKAFNPTGELTPYAYGVSNKGFMVNTSMNKIGLAIGINHYQRIYIPVDFNGVFYINSELGTKNPGNLYIKKE